MTIQVLIAPTTEEATSLPFWVRPNIGPSNSVPDLVSVAMTFNSEDAPTGNNVVYLQRKNGQGNWNTFRKLSSNLVETQLYRAGEYRVKKPATSQAVGADVDGYSSTGSTGE